MNSEENITLNYIASILSGRRSETGHIGDGTGLDLRLHWIHKTLGEIEDYLRRILLALIFLCLVGIILIFK